MYKQYFSNSFIEKQENKFLFLYMQPEITKFNIVSFYLIIFTLYLMMMFMNSFLVYILESPEYYNVPSDEVYNNIM
jgi:hypothetical protein